MPLYFFNVHDNGPAAWDDIGSNLTCREDIESHAMRLIIAARSRHKTHGQIGVTTTVLVQYEDGGIALTAIDRPGRDVLFVWSADRQ
ncbi:DUF6894 family protein [Methylobacterium gnaphalii]|uniref:DUF6894 family protein n=1 Tax=Methylobacterium gnaphalii TaxID=1010610 RepID=UPI0011BFCA81|nr:hypothetical protein [Methylobacterium gnaphalii]GLS47663.1 hypothetical protein GCM10007885_05070 [Methylobacterium gnaphalii]